MSILVTGGSGMFGRALVRRLSESRRIVAVSKSGRDGTKACDLSKKEQVRRLFAKGRFDAVVHTAAYSDVDGCERDPKLAHASNALATRWLAEQCGKTRTPFVYISTDYVFDGKRRAGTYKEEDPTCPINVYGMSKLEGEVYAGSLAGISAVVRTSWLFGAGNPHSFVNAVVERLKTQKQVSVLADQTDAPTYVEDLAEAVERITDHLIHWSRKNAAARAHLLFQVCNAGRTTRYGMTLKIRALLGSRGVRITRAAAIADRPALRPGVAVMSAARYEKFFKVKMRRWEEALGDYLTGGAR